MRRQIAAVALTATLVGCGGDEPEPEPEAAPTPEPATLSETCPEIEAALPKGFLPPAAKWDTYATRLDELAADGDTEVQNAIGVIRPEVRDLAADPVGAPLLDARQLFLDGLDTIAKRCKAVGSSALQ